MRGTVFFLGGWDDAVGVLLVTVRGGGRWGLVYVSCLPDSSQHFLEETSDSSGATRLSIFSVDSRGEIKVSLSTGFNLSRVYLVTWTSFIVMKAGMQT